MTKKEIQDSGELIAKHIMGKTSSTHLDNCYWPEPCYRNQDKSETFWMWKSQFKPDQKAEQMFGAAMKLGKIPGWAFQISFDEYGKWSSVIHFHEEIGKEPIFFEMDSFNNSPVLTGFNSLVKAAEYLRDKL